MWTPSAGGCRSFDSGTVVVCYSRSSSYQRDYNNLFTCTKDISTSLFTPILSGPFVSAILYYGCPDFRGIPKNLVPFVLQQVGSIPCMGVRRLNSLAAASSPAWRGHWTASLLRTPPSGKSTMQVAPDTQGGCSSRMWQEVFSPVSAYLPRLKL